ncbi:hypothetical protein K0651_09220 [Ornithinimicrobium sp. Arc0846-15]|nr:hypothetical protein [Ornithinimicrobium laminariae]
MVSAAGTPGLETVEREKPDLVMLGLYQPDVHGLRVLAPWRAAQRASAPE